MKQRKKFKWERFFVFCFMLVGSFIMVLPFIWMLLSSFKPAVELLRMPPTILPQDPSFDNFAGVLEILPFGRFFFNSILVSTLNTFVPMFVCSLTGYIFAKYKFWGRDIFFLIIIGGMMIPFQVFMIPLYSLIIEFKWVNTYYALTIPYFGNIFGMFLMRQFMLTVPNDFIDAATIDGCSHFGVFFRIIIPQVKAALAALAIFLFMMSWNDYIWPLIVINSEHMRTLPLGLGAFIHQRSTRYDLLMAASIMTILPIMVVFIIAQRRFIEGIALTGLKT